MLRKIAFGFAMTAVMLASGGCLLRASDSNEPTAIPQLIPSATPTPTLEPTLEPQLIVVTATPDPLDIVAAQPEITAIAQLGDPTIDPIILSVTETIAAATQISIDMTASAEVIIQLPTETPTIDPTLFVPTETPTTEFIGADCEHVVSAGQNLFRIGLQYGVSYQNLASYNGIANANLISIGQVIRIPNCGPGGSSTESGGFGGTGSTGSTGGGTGTIDTSTGSTCGSEIVVDQGDTLYAISLRCNVLIRTIMSLNGISNADMIYFNQTLRLQ